MQHPPVRRHAGARRRAVRVPALLVLVAALLLPPGDASGAAALDPSFGDAGKLAVPADGDDVAYAMTVDALDRIVLVGSVSNVKRFAVVRLEPGGSLDATFNPGGDPGAGRLVLAIPGYGAPEALAVAIDEVNQKIVLAGYGVKASRDDAILVRLDHDGALDVLFGAGGIAAQGLTTSATEDDRAQAVVVQDDGKIVAAGYVRASASDFDIGLARYTTSGDLDPSFGSGGRLELDPGAGKAEAFAIALDAAGRILVAGYALEGSEQDLLIARVTPAGALDTTFNGTGFVRIDVGGGADAAHAIAVLDDGDILVAGEGRLDGTPEFVVARLDASGALDASFGTGGLITTPIGTSALGRGIAVAPRGRFVVAGSARVAGDWGFAAVRYRADGSVDPTFGTDGVITVSWGGKRDDGEAVALQSDGSIVVAGTAQPMNRDFGVVRIVTDDCGDGVVDDGEECDGDELGGATCCSLGCTLRDAFDVCRPAAGGCDVAETCNGVDESCPADLYAVEGVACREAQGICDVAETCDGLGPACPPNQKVEAGIPCRASTGVCDPGEACDGTSATCPADVLAGAETVCRPASDACDAAETCDGVVADCPADLASPAGSLCRAAAGLCDVVETCDGVGFACPADEVVAADTTCRPAAGTCDVEDVCDGASAACPDDVVVEAGTTCREGDDVCDPAESCDGTSGVCPADVVLPDQDEDGICDGDDLCPELADALPQADADGDGAGDLCDPCTGGGVIAKTKLRITGYDTAPGDDVFFWRGILRFTEPPPFDPEATGARIVLEDDNGTRLFDAHLPAGAFDTVTRSGWRANEARSVFTFKTDDPVDGLVKKVRLTRRNNRPNRVRFRIDGKDGTYAQLPATAPTTAILVIDPAAVGLCGDMRFPGPEPEPFCRLDEEETRLTCR